MSNRPNNLTKRQGEALLAKVTNGSRVTILIPNGKRIDRTQTPPAIVQEWKEKTGHAVMRSGHGGWVLNMGGPHGTTGVCDDANIVKVRAATPERRRHMRVFNDDD